MTKLHPYDLACYDSVAKVVGHVEAMDVLQDAIDKGAILKEKEDDVHRAIVWAFTTAGIGYWADLAKRINQCEKWQEGEKRMNNIAQNGNDAEHYDAVNKPEHYQSENGIECIDAIRAALGLEGFVAHCRATAIKYAWRSGKKAKHAEDLRKGAWYLERAAKELEK